MLNGNHRSRSSNFRDIPTVTCNYAKKTLSVGSISDSNVSDDKYSREQYRQVAHLGHILKINEKSIQSNIITEPGRYNHRKPFRKIKSLWKPKSSYIALDVSDSSSEDERGDSVNSAWVIEIHGSDLDIKDRHVRMNSLSKRTDELSDKSNDTPVCCDEKNGSIRYPTDKCSLKTDSDRQTSELPKLKVRKLHDKAHAMDDKKCTKAMSTYTKKKLREHNHIVWDEEEDEVIQKVVLYNAGVFTSDEEKDKDGTKNESADQQTTEFSNNRNRKLSDNMSNKEKRLKETSVDLPAVTNLSSKKPVNKFRDRMLNTKCRSSSSNKVKSATRSFQSRQKHSNSIHRDDLSTQSKYKFDQIFRRTSSPYHSNIELLTHPGFVVPDTTSYGYQSFDTFTPVANPDSYAIRENVHSMHECIAELLHPKAQPTDSYSGEKRMISSNSPIVADTTPRPSRHNELNTNSETFNNTDSCIEKSRFYTDYEPTYQIVEKSDKRESCDSENTKRQRSCNSPLFIIRNNKDINSQYRKIVGSCSSKHETSSYSNSKWGNIRNGKLLRPTVSTPAASIPINSDSRTESTRKRNNEKDILLKNRKETSNTRFKFFQQIENMKKFSTDKCTKERTMNMADGKQDKPHIHDVDFTFIARSDMRDVMKEVTSIHHVADIMRKLDLNNVTVKRKNDKTDREEKDKKHVSFSKKLVEKISYVAAE